jgi:hypothetical protein
MDMLIESGTPPWAVPAYCHQFNVPYVEHYQESLTKLLPFNQECLKHIAGADGSDEFERSGMTRERASGELPETEAMEGDTVPQNGEGIPVAGGDGYSYSRVWRRYDVSMMAVT